MACGCSSTATIRRSLFPSDPADFSSKAMKRRASISSQWKPARPSPLALRYIGSPKKRWLDEAQSCLSVGFWGKTICRSPLYDATTGGCKDGLHPDRVNENQGAESTLSFLMALLEMQQGESNKRSRNASGNESLLLNPLIAPADIASLSSQNSASWKHCADLPLFTRYSGNPILSGQDWPYPINSVFNAGAVRCRWRHFLALPRRGPAGPVAPLRGTLSEWNRRMAH